MRSTFRGLVVAAVIGSAGCAEPPTAPKVVDRTATLERAFTARTSDPPAACDLFAAAGPGPDLETARFDAWYHALDDGGAGSDRWRAFLDAGPPPDLAADAVLGLAEALVGEGEGASAVAVLVAAPATVRDRADLVLLEVGDPAAVAAAAGRLARRAPQRLRSHSRELERTALAIFGPSDWVVRAAAWRAAGLGSRGAAEIRGRRWRGEQERERRIELARCELDAGSPGRAIGALPPRDSADSEQLVLRAEAHRRRGWSRVPDRRAGRAFETCLEEAALAVERGDDPAIEVEALGLVLECGVESDRLAAALAAWHRLEAAGWNHERRSWLGRRLGVALARSGADPEAVDRLASALPEHERCLRFWRARTAGDTRTLDELARAPIADLYGGWARRRLGIEAEPGRWTAPAAVGSADPPSSVAWLAANAGLVEASDEWQRILLQRLPTRAEGVAAAELAGRAGRPNTAIRTLRRSFPGIATVAIADTPSDAVEAYLPLRWAPSVAAAAAETGLEPWLIAAVARQESSFTAHARSPAGARGVLQLLPATARLHARALGLGSRPDLEDPAVNIRLGAHELAWLLRRFGAVEPALAAYNAGERRVRRWWTRWPEAEPFTESVPIPETYNYIRRVVFLADAYREVHDRAWRSMP